MSTLGEPTADRRGPSLPPGTPIGSYRIEQELGRGGFGIVYRAQHRVTGARAAVKVLHPHLTGAPGVSVDRFAREIAAIRSLTHPSIVRIFEAGQAAIDDPSAAHYFAMELLAGQTLRARLRSLGRHTPSATVALLEPICAALDLAHARGIVHRDVKASNIFLTDDRPPRVVLLDFGVAKLLDRDQQRLTYSGQVVGSPACTSPEQLTGRPIDARADVYALGVLAYELLTGSLPFRADDTLALYDMHLYAPPPLVSLRAPVPGAVDDVVARSMAKQPDERYRSGGELLAALRAAASQQQPPPRAPASVGSTEAVAVYVEFDREPNADLAVIDRLEEARTRAASRFRALGFRIALETGNSLLLLAGLPESGAAPLTRSQTLQAARASLVDLEAQGSVTAAAFVDLAAEQRLLRPGEWLPDTEATGLFASEAVLTGDARPTSPGPGRFRRVDPTPDLVEAPTADRPLRRPR